MKSVCDGVGESGNRIIPRACEVEEAIWSSGVTTERGTVHVEAETASHTMITIGNISRESAVLRVWPGPDIRGVDGEVGDELQEKRLG